MACSICIPSSSEDFNKSPKDGICLVITFYQGYHGSFGFSVLTQDLSFSKFIGMDNRDFLVYNMVEQLFNCKGDCMNKYLCSTDEVHKDRVRLVTENFQDNQTINDMSTLFSALSDPTRLKILLALEKAELCGCDLCAITGITKSAVSHQMRILKLTKLVKCRRQGKQIFFSLSDQHVVELLKAALEHVKEEQR